MEAKKAEPRDSRTPSVIGGGVAAPNMGRGIQPVQQQPYMPGKAKLSTLTLTSGDF